MQTAERIDPEVRELVVVIVRTLLFISHWLKRRYKIE
jgi:hypothetical protein